MLTGKTVVVGVTGSIAAYKIANLVRMLTKLHCDVHVLMTQNATQFINPITFETLTNHKCLVDTFDRNFNYNIEHVALAKKADLCIVAPASANVIGKIANGLADDMLTTTVLACRCKKIIAPAMNTNMYNNPIVQDNLEKLRKYGIEVIEPAIGALANLDVGVGKLPSEETLLDAILKEIRFPKNMAGKKVLITSGATQEALDPVRFVTNHSTGKMGKALAEIATQRGAEVIYVAAKTEVSAPYAVNIVSVHSAEEMFEAVRTRAVEQDIIIMAAAVSDYTPVSFNENKIKKSDSVLTIEFKRTTDILKYLGEHKKAGQFICGFSMETENLLENSRKKLQSKNADMIVANNLKVEGAGFGTDTNIVTLITKDKNIELPCMAKDAVAAAIFDEILKISQ